MNMHMLDDTGRFATQDDRHRSSFIPWNAKQSWYSLINELSSGAVWVRRKLLVVDLLIRKFLSLKRWFAFTTNRFFHSF